MSPSSGRTKTGPAIEPVEVHRFGGVTIEPSDSMNSHIFTYFLPAATRETLVECFGEEGFMINLNSISIFFYFALCK